jgi:hypothetical protein
MKRIATALAGAALLVSLAAPAEAAVAPRSGTIVRSSTDRQPPQCYGQHRRAGRDCTDERHPEHDGNGWLLF